MTEPSDEELREALKIAQFLETHANYNKMSYFKPIGQQRKFLAAGAKYQERVFMAGNRVGKSETGAFEAACHATGDYPDWWEGRKFKGPTRGWVAGTTSLDVRNVAQTKLCGKYGVARAFGTGFIPKDRFVEKPSLARGVADAYDTVQISHRTNGIEDGISTISFKSYEQGRAKFQGDELQWGWCDEEAPMKEDNDIYTEFMTRITDGVMFVTFTPMDGETKLTDHFLKEKSNDRFCIFLDLMDPEVSWYSAETKAKMVAKYPGWQRKARVQGIPLLGSGAVFPYDGELITEDPITYVPDHWAALWGIDFGIAHPFGAVLLLHDRDMDCIHVHKCVRMQGEGTTVQPVHHITAMAQYGASVPVAWPHDGTQREKGSGDQLAQIYKRLGAKMLPEHATFEHGGYSTEAGIAEMDQRMTTNRFKVGRDLAPWFEEFRSYHRKNGLIEKVRDDLLSATRIGVMAIRHARPTRLGNWKPARNRPSGNYAEDVPFDYFQT